MLSFPKYRGNELPSLKRNFSWIFVASIIYAFCQWLIIILLIKLGNVEIAGKYTLGLAITTPIYLFFQMNLRYVQLTDYNDEYTINEYFGFRIVGATVAFLFVAMLSLMVNFDTTTLMVILLISILKFSESLSDVIYGYFQKKELMNIIAISRISRSLLSVVTLALALYISKNILLSLFLFSLVWIATLIFYDFFVLKREYNKNLEEDYDTIHLSSLRPVFNLLKFKHIFYISIPLGIGATLDSLNINVPRYLINYFLDEEALGYFGAITFIIIAGQVIVFALVQTVIPRLSKYYNEEKHKFKNLLKRLMLIGLIIGLLGVILSVIMGEYLLLVLYSSEFIEYHELFVLLMIGAMFWYLSGFLNAAIVASRNFQLQLPIFILTLITTGAVSLYTIPTYGLNGAAVSLLLGFLVRCIISMYYIKCKLYL